MNVLWSRLGFRLASILMTVLSMCAAVYYYVHAVEHVERIADGVAGDLDTLNRDEIGKLFPCNDDRIELHRRTSLAVVLCWLHCVTIR